jgi:hypothetical protein
VIQKTVRNAARRAAVRTTIILRERGGAERSNHDSKKRCLPKSIQHKESSICTDHCPRLQRSKTADFDEPAAPWDELAMAVAVAAVYDRRFYS